MIQLSLVASVAVVAAAVLAVTTREGRLVALAMLVALAVAPFASHPLPGGLTIAARVVGAVLGAYMLWIAAETGVQSEGSAIGLPGELAVAAGAFALGWWVQPVNPMPGPVAEQAAGISLLAVATLPLIGRNVFRIGVGAAVLTLGITLLMSAWLAPLAPLAELAGTALLAAILGVTALLADAGDAATAPIAARDKSRPEAAGVESEALDLAAIAARVTRGQTVDRASEARAEAAGGEAPGGAAEGEAAEGEAPGRAADVTASGEAAERAATGWAAAGIQGGEAAEMVQVAEASEPVQTSLALEASEGDRFVGAGGTDASPTVEPVGTFSGKGRPPTLPREPRESGPMATRPVETRRSSLRLPGRFRNLRKAEADEAERAGAPPPAETVELPPEPAAPPRRSREAERQPGRGREARPERESGPKPARELLPPQPADWPDDELISPHHDEVGRLLEGRPGRRPANKPEREAEHEPRGEPAPDRPVSPEPPGRGAIRERRNPRTGRPLR